VAEGGSFIYTLQEDVGTLSCTFFAYLPLTFRDSEFALHCTRSMQLQSRCTSKLVLETLAQTVHLPVIIGLQSLDISIFNFEA